MKFKFIANACGIFESASGKKILCDPWIKDGIFEGSWCHFHPLETTLQDIQDVDAIYVSHLHPDHFDERYFGFDKNIPIIVLEDKYQFLIKKLAKLGYDNLIRIADDQTTTLFDFKLTLFQPFVVHNFHGDDAKIGNIIDSALIVENNGVIAFNANDNTPTPAASEMIRQRFGHVDLAMLNYNAAGPYPACFANLTDSEKRSEHKRILQRNFDYMLENIKKLKPKYVLPFAGAYVLGGKQSYKNPYLGTATWDACANYLVNNLNDDAIKVITLRENDVFDINSGTSNRPYVAIDVDKMNQYIKSDLAQLKYDYELDDQPDLDTLKADMTLATQRMFTRVNKIGIEPDMSVHIRVGTEMITICDPPQNKGKLDIELDLRLLRRVFDRKANWNNAEIGCHIEFNRRPNHYSPDMHMMLQFLHL